MIKPVARKLENSTLEKGTKIIHCRISSIVYHKAMWQIKVHTCSKTWNPWKVKIIVPSENHSYVDWHKIEENYCLCIHCLSILHVSECEWMKKVFPR